MNDGRYELTVAPSARRQLSEVLPEAVAFAAFEFIVGPLLDNPHRVGNELADCAARARDGVVVEGHPNAGAKGAAG